jgi:DNA end-binding protein Ku
MGGTSCFGREAIRFGQVHIPLELFSSEKNHDLDQTMVDRRDFSLVGYNKVTGKEVDRENIVKAYEYEADQ